MSQSTNKDFIIKNLQYGRSEAQLYSRFIKYNQLEQLCYESFGNNKIKEVNVYIDLYQLIMPIYQFENIVNPIGILATMVNMALHYRHFFNKHEIKSNIFVIYSSNNSFNNYRFIAGYNSKYNNRIINNSAIKNIIDKNISLMQTLFPYFPGVYLKTGTMEPTVIVYDLIDKFTKKGLHIPNIFVTSSDYAFQLPAILSNAFLFYKKTIFNKETEKTEEASFSVNNNNALYLYILKTKNKNLGNQNLNIPQNWLSPFLVLTGLQCRNVKSLFNYSKALKILEFIKDNYNLMTPDSIYNAIVDTVEDNKGILIEKNEIEDRYKAIDLDYQLKLYRELPESLETEFLIDLYDEQALHNIINTYFQGQNRIDIEKL